MRRNTMNIGADRRHFLVVIIVLAVLAFPNACTGRTGFAPQTEEAVFHFVGGNQEVEHNWPWGGIFCSYDLTVGCSLTSDMYGFRTYSVNSVTFVTQLYYVFQLPGECPVCETYYVFFGSEDFDLGAEASKVQLFAKGTFVNPTDEDIYTLWLTLKQNKTFNTPKGATVTYECDGGNELLIGTADSTYAYSENGAFWGHLT
ncbi:MAG: hypothetical protein JW952_04595, partial [Candidatus Eisenbacteria bacterium]|nr:hypothetical protein [Candidatus Eisenbacteria bacterium]